MMQIWILLIFLGQGYSLITVTTGQLGESVTFKCLFSNVEYSNTRIKWYKQPVGDTLTLITTLMKATTDPAFEQGFSPSRFAANYASDNSTLTILKTIKEDEALYHCAITTWKTDQWTGTFLTLNEKNTQPVNYTVVQWPRESDPVQPGDSVTLNCSILSDSLTWSCPSEQSVSWFGVRKDTFYGNVIYTDKNRSFKCDRKRDTATPSKSCVYYFSKNVSSSDSGTYYCALATHGEIIFGTGTKLEIEAPSESFFGVLQLDISALPVIWTVLTLTVLICLFILISKKLNSCKAAVCLQTNSEKQNVKREEDDQLYTAVVFIVIKNVSGKGPNRKAMERHKTFVAAKALEME